MSETLTKLQTIVSNQLGIEKEKVVPSADFTTELGADSLDVVELVMSFEEEFDIEIDFHNVILEYQLKLQGNDVEYRSLCNRIVNMVKSAKAKHYQNKTCLCWYDMRGCLYESLPIIFLYHIREWRPASSPRQKTNTFSELSPITSEAYHNLSAASDKSRGREVARLSPRGV